MIYVKQKYTKIYSIVGLFLLIKMFLKGEKRSKYVETSNNLYL